MRQNFSNGDGWYNNVACAHHFQKDIIYHTHFKRCTFFGKKSKIVKNWRTYKDIESSQPLFICDREAFKLGFELEPLTFLLTGETIKVEIAKVFQHPLIATKSCIIRIPFRRQGINHPLLNCKYYLPGFIFNALCTNLLLLVRKNHTQITSDMLRHLW